MHCALQLYVYRCMHVFTYAYVVNLCMSREREELYIHTYIHACIHTYIQTHIHIYIYMYICIYVHIRRNDKHIHIGLAFVS